MKRRMGIRRLATGMLALLLLSGVTAQTMGVTAEGAKPGTEFLLNEVTAQNEKNDIAGILMYHTTEDVRSGCVEITYPNDKLELILPLTGEDTSMASSISGVLFTAEEGKLTVTFSQTELPETGIITCMQFRQRAGVTDTQFAFTVKVIRWQDADGRELELERTHDYTMKKVDEDRFWMYVLLMGFQEDGPFSKERIAELEAARLAFLADLKDLSKTDDELKQGLERLNAASVNMLLTGIRGDADMDGVVTTTDARLTLQRAAAKIVTVEVNPYVMLVSGGDPRELVDNNGNLHITTTDARMILQYAAEKITSL